MSELYTLPLLNDGSLRAYYRFNSGAIGVDTKNGYTLTNYGAVSSAPGRAGMGADFGENNSSKYLRTTSNLGMNYMGPFSIAMWVKRYAELASGSEVFGGLGFTTDAGKHSYGFGYSPNNVWMSKIGSNGAGISVALGTTWNFLVFKHLGSSMQVNVNGVDGTAIAISGSWSGQEDQFYLGGYSSVWAKVIMDEVMCFNKVLSTAEILSLYRYPSSNFFRFMHL